MQYALPHPSRSIAIPLATLVLGAAGGATVAAIVADDEVIRLPSVNTPAAVQSDSFRDRPQEGTASQAMPSHPKAAGLSERSSDPTVQSTVNPFVERPQEGEAVRSIGNPSGPGLSEKSTDPSIQSSNNTNSLGARP